MISTQLVGCTLIRGHVMDAATRPGMTAIVPLSVISEAQTSNLDFVWILNSSRISKADDIQRKCYLPSSISQPADSNNCTAPKFKLPCAARAARAYVELQAGPAGLSLRSSTGMYLYIVPYD